MKIERPQMRVCVFVVVRRGDRFFPGTLFQDRHRRPAAGEPEKICLECFLSMESTMFVILLKPFLFKLIS